MPYSSEKRPNRVIHEQSPYLLQHAHNPVDWRPWGSQAFELARRENKPVFVSIGYATCHWCHVMERESFEDEEVAALLNEGFICIKVDREERPDVDGAYMAACQLLTGQGGWPLTVALTADKQPFFAGTYFPKRSTPYHIGMLELLPRLTAAWRDRSSQVLHSAKEITAALQVHTLQARAPHTDQEALDEALAHQAFQELAGRFDPVHGGFGGRPKFPTPHQLTFLLRYWKRTGQAHARAMAEQTLQAMRLGGIFDHVGFGFHRYSTDAQWLAPHFEKMLYDQALLAIAYTEAYQATGNAAHRQTAEEILAYVLRDMTAPEGGFYCAQDADSEGEEGRFYLWSRQEIEGALPADEARLVMDVFNVTAEGNYHDEASARSTGGNILHLKRPLSALAAERGCSQSDLQATLDGIRRTLFAVREKRVHPLKDDKVLTDWNGLMIAAMSKAAQAFDAPHYAQAATRACGFLFKALTTAEGELLHRCRQGRSAIPAYLDDHAFLIWGLLELYEATFDVDHLQSALKLARRTLQRFWDERAGGFFFTCGDGEALPVRSKDAYDGAVPSGNSVMMLNLLRLARLTGDGELEDAALRTGAAFCAQVRRAPSGFTQLLHALDFVLGPSHEVVIAGGAQQADALAMLHALRSGFFPNKVVLLHSGEGALERMAPWVKPYAPLQGKATAYVCSGRSCQRPATDVADLLRAVSV